MQQEHPAESRAFFVEQKRVLVDIVDVLLSYYLRRRVHNIFLIKCIEYICSCLPSLGESEARQYLTFLVEAVDGGFTLTESKYGTILRLREKVRREELLQALDLFLANEQKD